MNKPELTELSDEELQEAAIELRKYVEAMRDEMARRVARWQREGDGAGN